MTTEWPTVAKRAAKQDAEHEKAKAELGVIKVKATLKELAGLKGSSC